MRLRSEDFSYFKEVAGLVYLCPFSEQRYLSDCQLSGKKVGVSSKVATAELIQKLESKLNPYVNDFRSYSLSDWSSEEKKVYQKSYWFWVFHHYQDVFIDFISRQNKTDKKLDLPFGSALCETFSQIDPKHYWTERLVGISYQLWRAYYFLDQELLGSSPSMVSLRNQIWKNLFTSLTSWFENQLYSIMSDFSILIEGETGVGKSVLARIIAYSSYIPYHMSNHIFSFHFKQQLLTANLLEFPESILESQLFGHEKGAFTGAVSQFKGAFSRCPENGVVFLDEVGEIPKHIQIKLLRVLQDKSFLSVGGSIYQQFKGRIISATNLSIHNLLEKGQLREDFYYRISTEIIRMPSLRERLNNDQNELNRLIAKLVKKITKFDDDELVKQVQTAISKAVPHNYPWNGNIRELEQMIKNIIIHGEIKSEKLMPTLKMNFKDHTMSIDDLIFQYLSELYQKYQCYNDVAKVAKMDWRTVKKYLDRI